MLSIKKFKQSVHDWAIWRSEQSQFKYTWPLKGGWESWIQVDLMSYLFRTNDTLDILREQAIYRDKKKKVDLLLNCDSMLDKDKIPVELKAQSLDNHEGFINGVIKDCQKVQFERKSDYEESTCLVIGFCFEDNALKQLKEINVDKRKIFQPLYARDGEIAICVAELIVDKWKRV